MADSKFQGGSQYLLLNALGFPRVTLSRGAITRGILLQFGQDLIEHVLTQLG